MTVRVIDYKLANAQGEPTAYRLITSLMDWAVAPAHELAQRYHARWQVEAVFDEMKTHLRQSRRVLRSKAPDLVRQEFYGWVPAHYAVRWLLHQGASRHKLKAVRTTNKGSPRMVKRRNSPYASFSRRLPRKQPFDPNPTITPPMRQQYKLHHLYVTTQVAIKQ